MNKEQLIWTYRSFLHAFDLTPNEVVVDKTCMDVLMGHAYEVDKLAMMLHPTVHRFAAEIMEHEANNTTAMWSFLWSLDLHLMFDRPKVITVGGIVGSAESFISAPTTRTLH